MLSLSEYRQRTLAESINQENLSVDNAISMHLDLLKLKIDEKAKLPETILSEHNIPDFYLEKFLTEEHDECKQILHDIIDEHKSEIGAFFEDVHTGNEPVDKWGNQLIRRITKFMDRLSRHASDAMGSYGTPPPRGAFGGGGAAVAAPVAGGAAAPVSAGSAPVANKNSVDAVPNDQQKPSFWRRLFTQPWDTMKNIGKGVARGARRLAYDDPTIESINNVLVERNVDIVGEIERIKKSLIDYVQMNLPKLATNVGGTTAATAAEMPSTPEPTEAPEQNAAAVEDPAGEEAEGGPELTMPGNNPNDAHSPVPDVGELGKAKINSIMSQMAEDPEFDVPDTFKYGRKGYSAFTQKQMGIAADAIIKAVMQKEGLGSEEDVYKMLGFVPPDDRASKFKLVLGSVASKYGYKAKMKGYSDAAMKGKKDADAGVEKPQAPVEEPQVTAPPTEEPQAETPPEEAPPTEEPQAETPPEETSEAPPVEAPENKTAQAATTKDRDRLGSAMKAAKQFGVDDQPDIENWIQGLIDNGDSDLKIRKQLKQLGDTLKEESRMNEKVKELRGKLLAD